MPRDGRLAREIEFHRRIADHAEEVWNWQSPAGVLRANRRADLFVQHTGIRAGIRVLELGCGSAVFLQRVATAGALTHAVDLSWDLLTRARERVPAQTAPLSCGNAESLPYREGVFDGVYGSSVLHHLDPPAALRELFRVLVPGGRLTFTEPNILNPQIAFSYLVGPRQWFGLSPDEMAFSRFAAARMLREAGYTEISVRPFDFLHPATPTPAIALIRRVGATLESLPFVREIAGSLLIRARKPA